MENRPQPPLIQALLRPDAYDHAVREIQLVETHISWVLLTGSYAYKIKKPVNLGFLDFSTLRQRRFYCEQELRLNRRLAPALYRAVVPIVGTPESPRVGGAGEAIEYAVQMVQFPESERLDHRLTRGELLAEHIDLLAQELADFHGRAAVAGPGQDFGGASSVREPVLQNFTQIRPRLQAPDLSPLRRLEIWSDIQLTELRATFEARQRGGFIRECHGDAHLANMIWHEGRVVLFDCLEFNDNLRWIDVMSELAFVVMDLDDRGRPDLARRLLNRYLEHTGDYAGLAVFRFYQVYRALVRAKVACIRLDQDGLSGGEQEPVRRQYRSYANLAERYLQTRAPMLLITHGLSGSGKTWLTQQWLEAFDAIRLRSDIERKRLHGLGALERSDSNFGMGIYSREASERTYARLAELATVIVRAGHSVIVDAAFLQLAQRARLRRVADACRAGFVILDVHAPASVLRDRLRSRARQHNDASEADIAVLEHQLMQREPLTEPERIFTVSVDSTTTVSLAALERELLTRLAQTSH